MDYTKLTKPELVEHINQNQAVALVAKQLAEKQVENTQLEYELQSANTLAKAYKKRLEIQLDRHKSKDRTIRWLVVSLIGVTLLFALSLFL